MKAKNFIVKLRLCLMLLAYFIVLCLTEVSAQQGTPLDDKLKNIVSPNSSREWMHFQDSAKINPNTFFTDYKSALDLSDDDEMRIVKRNKDEIGFNHYKYQQYFKNIPVLYGEYIIHQQPDGVVRSGNGRFITGLNVPSVSLISEAQALTTAMQFLHAAKYLWQNTNMEKELKRQEKNQNATYFPKGELMYAPDNQNASFKPSDYRLTWHFKIYTDDPKVMSKNVYVDAATGKVIHYADISLNCSGGTGTSAFNGNVSISTYFANGLGLYNSHNDCQATNIYVYNCQGGGPQTFYYLDGDNTWTDQSAVQAQYGAERTYNYYLNVHSRTSWDNAAGDMIAYNNAYLGSNNACWGCTGNSTIFYAGNTTAANDDWNTDDIMGHEFTHGVTQASAGLAYQGESGALNESFSDIFGEMVESWAEGNCDYLVGADRGAIRSFINPKSYSQPDTYKGTNWYNTVGCTPDSKQNDNCGVHTNSGVQNHWFYLLAEGGNGTNDNGDHYTVTGITRYKARLIAYRALTVYLTSSSQFIDSRKATLEAASDLYGSCSQEAISVGDAWHAVGVESQSSVYTINTCGNYPASGSSVQAISTVFGGNGCITTITPSSKQVTFTARDKVDLLPGFAAQSGSNFVAYLEPCSSAIWGGATAKSDAEQGRIKSLGKATGKTSQTASQLETEMVTILPNPFNNTLNVSINATKESKAQVTIYNSLGVKIKEQATINLVRGVNKLSFDGSALAVGVYIVEVNFDNLKIVKKVIKTN